MSNKLDYRDAIRPGWMTGLNRVERKPKSNLRDWIVSGSFLLSPSMKSNQLFFDSVNTQEVLEVFASDINRFAAAGYESLCNIRPLKEIPKSTAWPLITLYYAALFYSHAFLRIIGVAPTYLDGGDVAKLKNLAQAYSIKSLGVWRKGIYTVKADFSQKRVLITSDKSDGGGHVHLWSTMEKAITELRSKLQSSTLPTSDVNILQGYLDSIIDAVAGTKTNIGRLSELRNNIQYRQGYGLWFPYSNELTVQKVEARIRAAMKTENPFVAFDCSNNNDLISFYESCCFLVAVARGVLSDLERYSDRSFLRFGPIRAENTFSIF